MERILDFDKEHIEIYDIEKQLEEIDKELNAYSETFDEYIGIYKERLKKSEEFLKDLNILKESGNNNMINNTNLNKYDDDFKIFEELEREY